MSDSCRYCGLPVSESKSTVTNSYWGGSPFVCHKRCKDAGVKQEAFDCQVIDADCNDCKHYQRGKLAPKSVSHLKTKDGRIVELTYQVNLFVGGRCLKFNRPTLASPNKWSGLECFEHRKSL